MRDYQKSQNLISHIQISRTSDFNSPVPDDFANIALHLALALRGIGLAQKYLWSSLETETSIFGVLFFDFGFHEATALCLDDLWIWIYLVAGITLLTTVVARGGQRPGTGNALAKTKRESFYAFLRQFGLCFCVACEVLLVAAIVYRDDAFRYDWTPATHALRIGVPVALCLSWPGSGAGVHKFVPRILRLAIALTFVGHGFNAWLQHPQYVTFILTSSDSVLGANLDQSTAEAALRWIAVLDFLAGVGVVFTRSEWFVSRWLLGYCAAWGLLTAASRVTAGGWMLWPETVLRAGHFLGPLALYAYWTTRCSGRNVPEGNDQLTDDVL